MNRNQIVLGFSERLVSLMREKGYISERSKSGIQINKLAKTCDCSNQMARKYILGLALPEVDVTVKIAKWLDISPGRLLFGETYETSNKPNLLCVEPDILEYILTKTTELTSIITDKKELVSFIMDIINDTTLIEADKKSILRVIDFSVNSVTRFKGLSHENASSADKR